MTTIIECERVHFVEDLYIPGAGDRRGINNSRSLGNDAPITHRVFLERETGLIEVRREPDGALVAITHVSRADVCPLLVVPTPARVSADLDITESILSAQGRAALSAVEHATSLAAMQQPKELVYAGPKEPEPTVAATPAPEPATPPAKGRGKRTAILVGDDGDEDT